MTADETDDVKFAKAILELVRMHFPFHREDLPVERIGRSIMALRRLLDREGTDALE